MLHASCVSRISFFFFFWPFLLFGEIGLDPDVSDEPQWYIPAGIELPDLQRSLTVIEQFETTPLDLEGKRAAQLLRKKRQTRRRRRRRRTTTTASDSEGETKDDDDDDDDDEERKRKVARKAREQEKYMSAQFIEDSDEEYGRDIEGFFAREAALRERTALAAIDSLSHIGTMRPTGTKKRRRAQQQPSLPTATDDATTASARQAKRTRRSAALSLTTSGMDDEDGEDGDRGRFNAGALRRSSSAAVASISDDDADDADGDDDDGGGDDGSGGRDIDHGDSSSLVYRDVAAGKHRHSDPPPLAAPKSPRRPRARPRYRGVALHASDDAEPDTPPAPAPPKKGTDSEDENDDVEQAQQGHDQPLPTGATSPMPPLPESHKGDPGRASSSTSSSNGFVPRKGRTRLIISDEEV